MKDKKINIKKIAQQIVEIEKKCQLEKDKPKKLEYLNQLERLTENLSLEELLEIDEYIIENNFLKK